MEFVSCGQILNAFGEKERKGSNLNLFKSFRRRRLMIIARRAPFPLTIINSQLTINNYLPFIFINIRIDPDIGFIAEIYHLIVPAFFFFNGNPAAVRF